MGYPARFPGTELPAVGVASVTYPDREPQPELPPLDGGFLNVFYPHSGDGTELPDLSGGPPAVTYPGFPPDEPEEDIILANPAWGSIVFLTNGVEVADSRVISGRIRLLNGDDLESDGSIIEVLVSDDPVDGSPSANAVWTAVPVGTHLDGIGSAFIRVRTSATGQFSITLSDPGAGTRYLWARGAPGSEVLLKAFTDPHPVAFA